MADILPPEDLRKPKVVNVKVGTPNLISPPAVLNVTMLTWEKDIPIHRIHLDIYDGNQFNLKIIIRIQDYGLKRFTRSIWMRKGYLGYRDKTTNLER